MVAIATLSIAVGVGETVTDDLLVWNLLSTDDNALPAASPITILAGANIAYSYERWGKVEFNGTFTTVTNVKVWKSAGVIPDGVNIKAAVVAAGAYAQPVNTASSLALNDMPENDGDAIDLQPAGGISSAGDYSSYCVLQAVISSGASAQTMATQTFTVQYDET